MHTDEYEISLGREITLCRKMVRQLKAGLERREKRMRPDDGSVSPNHRGRMPARTASHTELETGISRVAVLAKEVD